MGSASVLACFCVHSDCFMDVHLKLLDMRVLEQLCVLGGWGVDAEKTRGCVCLPVILGA